MDELIFGGSVPEFYDRYLQPILGGPYVAETVARAKALAPKRLLETAAGTGIITQALAEALPATAITATDISAPMIDYARAKRAAPTIRWQQADAQQLDFADHSFDLVVCQCGVMFFPDKPRGLHETRRVLRPGGSFLFMVWDSLAENELPRLAAETVARLFPDDPPTYTGRVPFGYYDHDRITAQLRAAGFGDSRIETVRKPLTAPSARDYAIGTCQGGGLRGEIEKRDPAAIERATAAVAAAVTSRFGAGPIRADSQALIITAA